MIRFRVNRGGTRIFAHNSGRLWSLEIEKGERKEKESSNERRIGRGFRAVLANKAAGSQQMSHFPDLLPVVAAASEWPDSRITAQRDREFPIPKGLCPPAQGCPALARKGGATLGNGRRLNQPQRGCDLSRFAPGVDATETSIPDIFLIPFDFVFAEQRA